MPSERKGSSLMRPVFARIIGVVRRATVLSLLPAAALPGQQSHSTAVTALSRRFPCRPFSFRITPVNDVAHAAVCSAVVAAVDQVARGNARTIGVVPADTARISAAWVSSFVFNTIGGTSSDAYWSVSLAVTGRRQTINVRIAYALDSIVVARGERPAP